jgi:hypothetical protein
MVENAPMQLVLAVLAAVALQQFHRIHRIHRMRDKVVRKASISVLV